MEKKLSDDNKISMHINSEVLQINIQLSSLKRLAKMMIFICFMLINVNAVNINKNEIKIINTMENDYPIIVRQRIEKQLINEVDNYIKKVAPSSKLEAKHLVEICNKYDIDIKLVLAQGFFESHFGTEGRAKLTNSVFNVGTWDSGTLSSKYRYKHPNESVEPYIKLLLDDYLVNGKTVMNLLQDYGFKNINGHRYASNTLYEANLRLLIVKITTETSIETYQGVLKLSDKEILEYFGNNKQQTEIRQYKQLTQNQNE